MAQCSTASRETCNKCKIARREWKTNLHCFFHHTEFLTLCGKYGDKESEKERKEQKQRTLDEIAKLAAALRNTEGGEILVHVEGQLPNRNLQHFDESIGQCLEQLIDDGLPYHDVFARCWMSDIDQKYKLYSDFVVISVTQTRGVATVLFNTKIRNDFENKTPHSLQVLSLLSKSSVQEKSESKSSGLPSVSPVPDFLANRHLNQVNLKDLQESRHTEFKRFQPDKETFAEWGNNPDRVANYIWSKLKLKDNISSLSKVTNGGSFYVGIGEITKKHKSYTIKELEILGIDLRVSEKDLKASLEKKIKENISVLQSNRFKTEDSNFFKIKFHHLEKKTVLEVSVCQVDGIVFYDKDGPRTYVVDGNETKKMEKEEWLKRMIEHHVKVSMENLHVRQHSPETKEEI